MTPTPGAEGPHAGGFRDPRLITPQLLREWPLPEPDGDKYARGAVVVVGGAARTPGAVVLAGRAALRVGAGRLTLALAASVAGHVAVAVPESGVVPLAESDAGSVTGAGAGGLLEPDVRGADGVLVGPGLDDAEGTVRLLEELAPALPAAARVVLDAYAFTVLPEVGRECASALSGRLLCTGNADELARVVGEEGLPVEAVPSAALEVARRFGASVSCAGWVVTEEGVWRCSTGDTGLGTSGSGDVLAGTVTGLVARGADPVQSLVWGTHVHAAAGDALAARLGRVGYLAHELLDEVPLVLRSLRGD